MDTEEELGGVGDHILAARSRLTAEQSLDGSTQASIAEQLQLAVNGLQSTTASIQMALALSRIKTDDILRWHNDYDEKQRRVHETLNAVIGSLNARQTGDTQSQGHAAEQLLLAYYDLSHAKSSAQQALIAAGAAAETGRGEPPPTAASASPAAGATNSNSTPGAVVVALIGAFSGFLTAIAGLITALVTWRKARREEPAAARA